MNRPLANSKVGRLRPATVELRGRTASRAEAALPVCVIVGCSRPTAARAGKGLSLYYCRRCCQSANRHGCHWKKTYPTVTLEPYRRAAGRFIETHPYDVWIVAALHALQCLMDYAGLVERIVDVNQLLKPPAKAQASLARLRRAEVDPKRLLVNYLAVAGAIAEDPISPGSERQDYQRTQAAKVVFRLASGSHVVYGPGNRYDRYPRSGGAALRHLGKALEEACEHVEAYHLAAILSLKAGAPGASDEGRYAASAGPAPAHCQP